MAREMKKRKRSVEPQLGAPSPQDFISLPDSSPEPDQDVDTSSAVPVLESIPEEPEAKRQQQRRSLFVRGLPSDTTTQSLVDHFSADFPIKHGHAVTDPTSKICKGYGFVAFADAEDAARALKELDGSEFNGKTLRLEIAEPRKRDADDTLPEEMRRKSRTNATAVELKERRRLKLSTDDKQRQPPKLIIRNLPWSIKEPDQLAQLFLPYGKVHFATLPKKGPKTLAGFGFVMLRGHKNAEAAIEGVNGKEIDGRRLAVDWAVDKSTWDTLAKKSGDKLKPEETDDVADVDVPEDDSLESDEDDSDIDLSSDEDDAAPEDETDEAAPAQDEEEDRSATVFVRNVAFTTTDDELYEHFRRLAPVRYARTVIDQQTERPRGTAFVCFRSADDAKRILTGAPRDTSASNNQQSDRRAPRSLLQSETADPTGSYTLGGRVLQLAAAVNRTTAANLEADGQQRRTRDKRRLYLLSEGTLPADSAAASALPPSEAAMRSSSLAQRKQLLQRNPSLHLSLTRLSVRNAPRSLSSAGLKALARQAVVGFAEDVKAGKRERLSREELAREADAMAEADAARRRAGKGVVRQAKIVFEGASGTGSKVDEDAAAGGGGRSRGYGFVEYHTHRAALMGLRWLNGHAVTGDADVGLAGGDGDGDGDRKGASKGADKASGKGDGKSNGKPSKKGKPAPQSADTSRAKRLIVEFAIENAQVVQRRQEREKRAREGPPPQRVDTSREDNKDKGKHGGDARAARGEKGKSRDAAAKKQKHDRVKARPAKVKGDADAKDEKDEAKDDKLAKRTRIIAKKRAQRREGRKQRAGKA